MGKARGPRAAMRLMRYLDAALLVLLVLALLHGAGIL
jgi:hypothetical protein